MSLAFDVDGSNKLFYNDAAMPAESVVPPGIAGYINNYKNARICVFQEYAPENEEDLPDENFSLRLGYLTSDQIIQMREAYDVQALEIENEIDQTARVVEQIQTDHNKVNKIKT